MEIRYGAVGGGRDEVRMSINGKSFNLGEGHIKVFYFCICLKFLINKKEVFIWFYS